MAVLVSGPINGIVLFSLKDSREIAHSQIWLTDGQSVGSELHAIAKIATGQKIKCESPIYPQIVTRLSFSTNMQELTASGPDRHFFFYRVSQPKIQKVGQKNEYPFVKEFRDFMPP